MNSAIELVSFVTRAENRVTVLLALASGPKTRPALQDDTGIPRATLSRILADFRDRELVRRDGQQYHSTELGDHLADGLESLFESVEAMETLQTVRQWLSIADFDIPVQHFADADVILPEPTDPLAPIRRAEELLTDGTRAGVAAHNMIPSCFEVIWRAVMDGRQTVEIVTTPDAMRVADEDAAMTEQARDLLASENASMFVHGDDVLPALIIVDDVVFLAVADDTGTIRGHVESTEGPVMEWAEATFDTYKREAEAVSSDRLTT